MPILGGCIVCKGQVSSEAKLCPHCGQPDPFDDDSYDKVDHFIKAGGSKILAIKLFREQNGVDLKTARDYIESHYSHYFKE